jgi:hypothetical protein
VARSPDALETCRHCRRRDRCGGRLGWFRLPLAISTPGTRHAGWSHHWQPGGPMLVAENRSEWSRERGRRHDPPPGAARRGQMSQHRRCNRAYSGSFDLQQRFQAAVMLLCALSSGRRAPEFKMTWIAARSAAREPARDEGRDGKRSALAVRLGRRHQSGHGRSGAPLECMCGRRRSAFSEYRICNPIVESKWPQQLESVSGAATGS